MKIALISRWLWEEHRRTGSHGGTVEQLVHAIQDLGHEVIALSQSSECKRGLIEGKIGQIECWLTPRENRAKSHYVSDKVGKFLTGHRKVSSDAAALTQFLKKRGPFDLIWAQCEEPDGLVATWAAKNQLLPLISTQVFALRYDFQRGGAIPRFKRKRILDFVFQKSKNVIANSPLTAKILNEQYKVQKEKIIFVPHNLTNEFLNQANFAIQRESNDQKRILFLGALNQKKGVLTFLRAAQSMAKQNTKLTFVIVGSFTEKNRQFEQEWNETLKKSNLNLQLELCGHLSAQGVQEQIQNASLVVLPSLFDEFSRALVEVLALGKPVITTHGVGASYLLERDGSGLIITPGNEKELITAIETILDNPKFENQARKKASYIGKEFAPQSIARQLIEIWQNLI